MKRIVSFILTLAIVLGMLFSLTACSSKNEDSKKSSGSSKKKAVGVWQRVDDDSESEYWHVYEDGTGEVYRRNKDTYSFTWELNGTTFSMDAVVGDKGFHKEFKLKSGFLYVGETKVYEHINKEVSKN